MRDPKYDKVNCDALIKVMRAGGSVASVCVALDICKSTFYNWLKDYPEFNTAYERGKVGYEAFLEELITLGASGRLPHFNATAALGLANNKLGWTRGPGQGGDTNISIGNMNVLQSLPDTEFKRLLEDKMKQYRLENPQAVLDVDYESN